MFLLHTFESRVTSPGYNLSYSPYSSAIMNLHADDFCSDSQLLYFDASRVCHFFIAACSHVSEFNPFISTSTSWPLLPLVSKHITRPNEHVPTHSSYAHILTLNPMLSSSEPSTMSSLLTSTSLPLHHLSAVHLRHAHSVSYSHI